MAFWKELLCRHVWSSLDQFHVCFFSCHKCGKVVVLQETPTVRFVIPKKAE